MLRKWSEWCKRTKKPRIFSSLLWVCSMKICDCSRSRQHVVTTHGSIKSDTIIVTCYGWKPIYDQISKYTAHFELGITFFQSRDFIASRQCCALNARTEHDTNWLTNPLKKMIKNRWKVCGEYAEKMKNQVAISIPLRQKKFNQSHFFSLIGIRFNRWLDKVEQFPNRAIFNTLLVYRNWIVFWTRRFIIKFCDQSI